MRCRMGVISDCRIDCKISVTVLRWMFCEIGIALAIVRPGVVDHIPSSPLDGIDVPWIAYLALLVCAIGRVLQRSFQGLFRLARSHQLLDLAGKRLDIFGRDGLDGGGEGREVEVVRGFRVERVDVECSPVEVGHLVVCRCL
jgi:hypothetical protein